MKRFMTSMLMLLFMTACSNVEDLVRDSTYTGDPSITMGQLLDSYSVCSDTRWSSFETDRGQTIVQYTCDYPLMAELVLDVGYSSIRKRMSKQNERGEFEDFNYLAEYVTNTVDYDLDLVIQFSVAQDLTSLRTTYAGFKFNGKDDNTGALDPDAVFASILADTLLPAKRPNAAKNALAHGMRQWFFETNLDKTKNYGTRKGEHLLRGWHTKDDYAKTEDVFLCYFVINGVESGDNGQFKLRTTAHLTDMKSKMDNLKKESGMAGVNKRVVSTVDVNFYHVPSKVENPLGIVFCTDENDLPQGMTYGEIKMSWDQIFNNGSVNIYATR